MGEVKIVTGPPSSGKSRWANDWVARDRNQRVLVGTLEEATIALAKGLDVVMDLEKLSQHDVEVVTFSA